MPERFDGLPDPPEDAAAFWNALSLAAVVLALIALTLVLALIVLIVTGSLTGD
jgi:hypothetical protein